MSVRAANAARKCGTDTTKSLRGLNMKPGQRGPSSVPEGLRCLSLGLQSGDLERAQDDAP